MAASYVGNILTKSYHNWITLLQVSIDEVENVSKTV